MNAMWWKVTRPNEFGIEGFVLVVGGRVAVATMDGASVNDGIGANWDETRRELEAMGYTCVMAPS